MRHFLVTAALAAVAAPAIGQPHVSVEVGHPGFYGRIDIGGFPPPPLIFPEPVIIEHRFYHVVRRPIYLHVPPGHAKHWAKHCHKYDACGRRVYFVQNAWYDDVYVPVYRERHGGGKAHSGDGSQGKGKGKGKGGKGKGKKH